MKNKLVFAFCLASAAITIVLAPLFLRRGSEEVSPASSAQTHINGGYYLMEYNGMIGVFAAGSGEPLSVLDVDVRTLPDADRSALADGVFAADEEELNRRIEDFSS